MPKLPKRYLVPIAVVLVLAGVSWWWGDALTVERLADRELVLRDWWERRPGEALLFAFLAYVMVTALMLPGAATLTLMYAWVFGFGPALVLVSFASTLGATIAFVLSRHWFREPLQRRFGERLVVINRALEREGALYLLTLRLIPAVPFFVINTMMGLTPMRVRTFWWVSQLGMLPGTIVYAYAGSRLPSLHELAGEGVGAILTPQILVAFVVLGLFPLVVRWLVHRLRGAGLRAAGLRGLEPDVSLTSDAGGIADADTVARAGDGETKAENET